jgi:hypothetical protein
MASLIALLVSRRLLGQWISMHDRLVYALSPPGTDVTVGDHPIIFEFRYLDRIDGLTL